MSNLSHHLPDHIAIIMDGNGRWAERRGRARSFGHRAGRDALKKTVTRCAELKIPMLTVFAFSSENWNRPAAEVRVLMELLRRALQQEIGELNKNDIRIRFIGDTTAFSPEMQRLITQSEESTAGNQRMLLNVALNYGGRWDVLQACQKLMSAAKLGTLRAENLTEKEFESQLALSPVPAPDLLIRTGGEKRLSNFLLWELAYTELIFSDLLWPDFDGDAIDAALADYQRRERRFGHTPAQVAPARSA